MLASRLLTAAVGIPLFGAALYFGGAAWAALLALIAWLGAGESYRLARGEGNGVWFGRLLALSIVAAAYSSSGDGGIARLLEGTPLFLLAATLAYFALGSGGGGGLQQAGAAVAAGLYPALLLAPMLRLRESGLEAALFAVLVTWATDTGAYAWGSALGKRFLWPSVSPKKTVEGAVGGVASGVLVGVVLAALWRLDGWAWGAVACVASVAAQAGDLVESGIKRKAGVKDSGHLLPGHGGVLDRFDSLLFSGTAVYYLQSLLR